MRRLAMWQILSHINSYKHQCSNFTSDSKWLYVERLTDGTIIVGVEKNVMWIDVDEVVGVDNQAWPPGRR